MFFKDLNPYDDVWVFSDYVNDFLLCKSDRSAHCDEFVVDTIDTSKEFDENEDENVEIDALPSSAVVVDETMFDRHSPSVQERLSASEEQQLVLSIVTTNVLSLLMLLEEQVRYCLTIEFDEEMAQ